MSIDSRYGAPNGTGAVLGRASSPAGATLAPPSPHAPAVEPLPRVGSPELARLLVDVRGQAQFLLYLADQLEDSLQQLANEADPGHGAFLCKIVGMYAGQLESKHQQLGDKIGEASQEIYVTLREHDAL
jgi:hypothetical protein